MAEQGQETGVRTARFACAIILAAGVIVAGCEKKPAESAHQPADTGPRPHPNSSVEAVTDTTTEPPTTGTEPVPTAEPPATGGEPAAPPRRSLSDVIRSARGWGPAYPAWRGKMSPDFSLTDIGGKAHKLSDYRGKDVMLVFWATWCKPCLLEIPHLIALQNVVGQDKLAILAISYTSPINTNEMVRSFVGQNTRINYTVFCTDVSSVPAPFDTVDSIPTSFFIDPDGRIKLATSGLLSLGYMKAILEAE